MEGNKRYTSNMAFGGNETPGRRKVLAAGQKPFATIFSCVDSRVPPELVFDRGLGDLFVIRSAGEVVDKAILGSLEFGVAELKIPLLVVLGHEKCGAINATISTVKANGKAEGEIEYLVESLTPAVKKVLGTGGDELDKAVRTNVEMVVESLKASPILEEAIKAGTLKIVGARYALESGVVEITVS